MMTVVVTSRSFGTGHVDVAAPLRERGAEVVRCRAEHDLEELRPVLARAVAWIAGTGPIGARHLEMAAELRVIARYGVGVDSVDLKAATSRGVTVTNTPGANSESVADYALGLIIVAARRIVEGDRATRVGDLSPRPGREIGTLTVGVLGFGRVGRALATRLTGGFGTQVLVHDPFVEDGVIHAAGCTPVSLDELAARADVVSLHLPGGGAPVVDREFLARARPGLILINTARGDLLDDRAVADALEKGILSRVAVDVLGSEPSGASALLDAPGAVVTPHLAAQTAEAIDRMGAMAVADVLNVLEGRSPAHPVAVPDLASAGQDPR